MEKAGKFWIFIALIPLSSFACKSTSGRNAGAAKDWGQSLTLAGSLACQEEPSDEKLLQSYVREHLRTLTSGNPKIFQGELALDRLCVVPVKNRLIDAGSSPDGSIYINSGVLQASETDAQFAAVIAHEMAHISLRHGEVEIADFVRTHPQYLAQYSELGREKQKIRRYDILHTVAEDEWSSYIDKLKAEVRKKWNAAHSSSNLALRAGQDCNTIRSWESPDPLRTAMQKNLPSADYESKLCQQFFQEFNYEYREGLLFSTWKEIEADEVGYEYFLRAGYPEDEYAQFFANSLQLGGAKEPNCERGDKDHPGDCWRAKNIRAELKHHKFDSVKPQDLRPHNFADRLKTLRAQYGISR